MFEIIASAVIIGLVLHNAYLQWSLKTTDKVLLKLLWILSRDEPAAVTQMRVRYEMGLSL